MPEEPAPPAPPSATDWRPRGDRARWERRARLIARVRDFFAARGVLEVETPLLGARGAMDPALESFSTVGRGERCAGSRPPRSTR